MINLPWATRCLGSGAGQDLVDSTLASVWTPTVSSPPRAGVERGGRVRRPSSPQSAFLPAAWETSARAGPSEVRGRGTVLQTVFLPRRHRRAAGLPGPSPPRTPPALPPPQPSGLCAQVFRGSQVVARKHHAAWLLGWFS